MTARINGVIGEITMHLVVFFTIKSKWKASFSSESIQNDLKFIWCDDTLSPDANVLRLVCGRKVKYLNESYSSKTLGYHGYMLLFK